MTGISWLRMLSILDALRARAPSTALAKCKESCLTWPHGRSARRRWRWNGWLCVLQQLIGNAYAVREAAKVIASRVPKSNPRYPPRAELFEIWGLAAAGKAEEALAGFVEVGSLLTQQ